MPNVAGIASTKRQIFGYALIVAAAGVLPALLGYASTAYGLCAAALGSVFVRYAWKVLVMPESDRSMAPAKALFGYSLFYLFAIFTAYLADALAARALSVAGA
jgi:heme o synthase